jgi:hypothetical protein
MNKYDERYNGLVGRFNGETLTRQLNIMFNDIISDKTVSNDEKLVIIKKIWGDK